MFVDQLLLSVTFHDDGEVVEAPDPSPDLEAIEEIHHNGLFSLRTLFRKLSCRFRGLLVPVVIVFPSLCWDFGTESALQHPP